MGREAQPIVFVEAIVRLLRQYRDPPIPTFPRKQGKECFESAYDALSVCRFPASMT